MKKPLLDYGELADTAYSGDFPIEDYNSDGTGVIYLGKKANDKRFVKDTIDRLVRRTEIVTDGTPVTEEAARYIKDIIWLFNWKSANEDGTVVDYGTVKLKVLDDSQAYEDGLSIIGKYDTIDKDISLNPVLYFLPKPAIKGTGAHEMKHKEQHIKKKIEKSLKKYSPAKARYELEAEAYRTMDEAVCALYSPEAMERFIGMPLEKLPKA